VEVVRRASQQPPDPRPEQARAVASRPEDAPLVALAEALLRARAREAGLAYELLASRADLQAIIAAWRVRDGSAAASREASGSDGGEGDVRTMRGWRRQLVGEELLALLDGHVSLSVSDLRLQVAIRCGCRLRTAEGT
jgi:ribonuclease D